MPATFSSDQPISSKSGDLIRRAPFALRIAETIATRQDKSSIAIGLYGAWGEGKTSVLRMMQEYLNNSDNIITIDFNPWLFKSQESLLYNFFLILAKKLDSSLEKKPEIKWNRLENYTAFFRYSLKKVYKKCIAFFWDFLAAVDKKVDNSADNSLHSNKEKIGALLGKYGDAISFSGINLGKLGEALAATDLEDLKGRVEKILEDQQKKVVIFIDDIDRLDRDETYAIFKLVRLTASFNHTTYVLAFDHDIVSSALGERYAQGGQAAGQAFLEKIIQVPLHLPPADAESLRQVTLQGVKSALIQAGISLENEQWQHFIHCFDAGIKPRLNTLRLSRLYHNALLFALPLLKGEVSPVDHMLIEGIRICYPGLYKQIRKTPQFFLTGLTRRGLESKNIEEHNEFAKDLLAKCLPELANFEHQKLLDGLLPRIFPALCMHGVDKKDADTNKRICSERYFWKYFMYSVPSNDLSDMKLDYFLASLANDEEADFTRLFADVDSKKFSLPLLRKLHNRVPGMDEHVAYNLFKLFVENAYKIELNRKLSGMGDPFGWDWGNDAHSMAKKLIVELLRKVTDQKKQEELVLQFVKAEPLDFVVTTFFYDIRLLGREIEELRVVSDKIKEAASCALADRLLDIDLNTPLYAVLNTTWLCYSVVGTELGYQVFTERLKSRFDSSPKEVDLFLSCFAGQIWALDSYEPECDDLNTNTYVEVSRLIEPQYIVDNLISRFGDALNEEINRFEGICPKLKVARRFAELHRAALSEEKPQNETVA